MSTRTAEPRTDLRRYAWLSIAAAVLTILLKYAAYAMTGSVGLLSDAAESVVNLVAAVIALAALTVAVRPADEGHHYGHGKAEYLSAGVEGMLIFLAAGYILVSAVERLLHPQPLERLGIGILVSSVATLVNGVVGTWLIRVGRRHRSPTLVADGKHLLTDVWTSVGVVAGVLAVAVTGWVPLDSLVAIAVAVNILWIGSRLVSGSVTSLLDAALPEEDLRALRAVVDAVRGPDVDVHGLQTRESGRQRFVTLHLLVPGDWTVRRGHDVSEELESAIDAALPGTVVTVHIEPREDGRAYEDFAFDSGSGAAADGRPLGLETGRPQRPGPAAVTDADASDS